MLGCVYGDNVLPFLVLRDAGWSEKRGEAIVAGVATFWRQDARRGHLVFRTPFFFCGDKRISGGLPGERDIHCPTLPFFSTTTSAEG